MRIAYLVNHIGRTGGLNNMVLDMTDLFIKHGHSVCVFYFKKHEMEMAFPCETRQIRLSEKIAFENYDIIHCHGIKPNAYVLFHKPLKHIKTRFVATLHCYVFQDFFDLYGKVKGFLGSLLFLISPLRHDVIVTLSKDALNYYRNWFPFKKMTFAYNTRCIDSSQKLTSLEFDELMEFKKDSILLGMNCVLILRKGVDTVLLALKRLPPKYKLVVLGGYESPEFMRFRESMIGNLEGRVLFLGMKKDAYRYLPYYDIYVMASRSEGFPLSLVEAAAYGKRIVSTSLAQFKEIFSDDDVAYYEPGDVDGLIKAIDNLNEMVNVEKNVIECYNTKLSPESFYKRYFSIYEDTYGEDY